MSDQGGASRFRFGLTGWPLGHSLSPAIHMSALKALGLKGKYLLYPVPVLPAGSQDMDSLIRRLRRGDLQGLNVTLPHKQSIIPFLDRLSTAGAAIGAVNLVYRENDQVVGDNSDAAAFMTDLQRLTGEEDQPGTALILGAGGAARAAVYALLQVGWRVFIASRRLEAARQLVRELNGRGGTTSAQLTALSLESASLNGLPGCDLVVNTTPAGMFPHIHETPWPAGTPFPRSAAFYDMVYNPAETALVKAARLAGLAAANGLGMLVEQAALSFERWTGLPAPRERMWEAAAAALPVSKAAGAE